MSQFNLFKDLPKKKNPFVDGVVCIKCGIRQPITKLLCYESRRDKENM